MRRRRRPPNRLARHTDPVHIFIAGIVTIVAFLFQGDLYVRIAQVLLFALLATFAGKRIRWGYFLIMVSSITFFNLLTPVGRVLVQVGPFAVTQGALSQGLLKGFAIVGLVFISLFAVRSDLRLPGSFGGMLARLFFYFELVLETRRRVSARRLIESVDAILLDLYPVGATGDGAEHEAAEEPHGDPIAPGSGADGPDADRAPRTDAIGAALMVAVVLVNVGAAIVTNVV